MGMGVVFQTQRGRRSGAVAGFVFDPPSSAGVLIDCLLDLRSLGLRVGLLGFLE